MGLMWIAEIHLRLRSTQPRLSPLISINTNRYVSRDPYAWGYLHRALECRASFKRASETLKDFANLTLPNELHAAHARDSIFLRLERKKSRNSIFLYFNVC